MSKEPSTKNKLYSLLYTRLYRKLETTSIQQPDGKKVIEFKQANIHNKHGLEISDFSLQYEPAAIMRNCYTIKAYFRITDILPFHHAIETYYISKGSTLEEVLTTFLYKINEKVYCRDCGHLRVDSDYVEEEEQCLCCLMESVLTVENEAEFCSICQSDTSRYVTLRCTHKFHRKCISKLVKNNCPLCNRAIEVIE